MATPLPTGRQLDRQVTLQRNQPTRDGAFGASVDAWVTEVDNLPAHIVESPMPASAPGAVVGALNPYGRPDMVTIRWRVLDKATHRLVYGSRVLRIVGTAELGRRQWLQIACVDWSHEHA